MTDVRATQGVAQVLSQDPADAHVTQSVVLVLAPDYVPPDTHVTQGVALVLYQELVDAHLTQSLALALTRELPHITHECQVWKITRKDGEVFRLTTHDEVVTFKGEIYYPCDSLSSTASSTGQSASGAGDVTIKGVISADGITAEDLAFGKFDGARVVVWVTQWAPDGTDELAGRIPVRLAQGVLGAISQEQAGFTAELRSPAARLTQQPLLHPYSPACRFKFGGPKCQKDLGPLEVSGTVDFVPQRLAFRRETYRMFRDSGRTEADDYFTGGNLMWTTGANAGLTVEVSGYTQDDGEIILWVPCPHEVSVGDTYTMTPGCALTVEACQNYANYINFGGFPNIPGMDFMAQTPNAH